MPGGMPQSVLSGKLRLWQVDAELLDAAGPALRGVSTFSVGYDHIDVGACAERGVAVGNTPGVLTETTADTAFALMIATARRVPEAVDAVKNGGWRDWRPEWMCGKDVWGSAVGIIGLGRIGLAFARRVSGFGCAVLYSGRSRKPEAEEELLKRGCRAVEFVSQEELLERADFVVPMCELNEETRGMFCMPLFRRMKSDAVLINITRGAVVNQVTVHPIPSCCCTALPLEACLRRVRRVERCRRYSSRVLQWPFLCLCAVAGRMIFMRRCQEVSLALRAWTSPCQSRCRLITAC